VTEYAASHPTCLMPPSETAAAISIRDYAPDLRADVVTMIGALSTLEAAIEADRVASPAASTTYWQDLEARISNKGGFVLTAHASDISRPIGYAATLISEDSAFIAQRYRRHAYISDLFVASDYRRQGVARLLVQEIKARATAMGVVRIGVGALAGNEDARAAYARLGFRAYVIDHVLDLDCVRDGAS